jgi:serine/threonine protein kinase
MGQPWNFTTAVQDAVKMFPPINYDELKDEEMQLASKLSEISFNLQQRGVQRPAGWIERIRADRPVIVNNSGESQAPEYENYEFIKPLGKGDQGRALVYVSKRHNIDVVFKIADRGSAPNRETPVDEFLRARGDKLPVSIVRLVSIIGKRGMISPTIRINEHCELGDLSFVYIQHRANQEQVPEERIWYVLRQISLALAYLHEGIETAAFGELWKPIWHRDVRMNNIFLAKPGASSERFVEWEPKLGDFDSAIFKHESRLKGALDAANDVYQLGSVIYALCLGSAPRMAYEMADKLHRIGLLEQRPERPPPGSPGSGDCLVAIPVNTPSQKLEELGLPPGQGGYSEALERVLRFALHPDKAHRSSAAKLNHIATKFYNLASFKAMRENPESVSDFQDKFAAAVKDWGLSEVLSVAATTDTELHKMRNGNLPKASPMDIDDDEDQEDLTPQSTQHPRVRRVRFADDAKPE